MRVSLPKISNLQFLDFLKYQFERFFRADLFRWFNRVRGSVTNWYDYYFVNLGVKRSAYLKLKTGEKIEVRHESFEQVFDFMNPLFEMQARLEPFEDGYFVTLKEGIQFFVRKYSETFTLFETFVQQQYKNLNVKNKLVIDIGANIGDSAVYFCKVGNARKVYAFEPFPYSYALAKINTELNHAENVVLVNKAVGDKRTTIVLDPSYASAMSDQIRQFTSGVTLEIVTLHDVISSYGLDSAVIKIDCEGCEYGLILGSSPEDLRRFDQIIVECHYGYVNIEEKLRSVGFRTQHTPVRYFHNSHTTPEDMCMNLVLATKA